MFGHAAEVMRGEAAHYLPIISARPPIHMNGRRVCRKFFFLPHFAPNAPYSTACIRTFYGLEVGAACAELDATGRSQHGLAR